MSRPQSGVSASAGLPKVKRLIPRMLASRVRFASTSPSIAGDKAGVVARSCRTGALRADTCWAGGDEAAQDASRRRASSDGEAGSAV